jgi:3'(2'), 5'-bisphosphate nucleotidase
MSKTTIEQHMATAYAAALEAGEMILEVYESSDFDVEQKDDKSPLTLADRRAHDALVERLEGTGLPILSEEGADIPIAERGGWERYWLVDPLDGTKEFIKRNGEFTVNIALMSRNEPAAGIVLVPVKDIAYVGIGGKGAWKIEAAQGRQGRTGQGHVRRTSGTVSDSDEALEDALDAALEGAAPLPLENPAERPFSAVMSRSHNSPETEEYVSRLEESWGKAERVSSGSSIKLCLVAEGTADVYPRFAPTMEWDTAAGDAVCRAAGCRVTEKDEVTPLAYNKEDLHNPWFVVLGPRVAGGPAGRSGEEGGASGGGPAGGGITGGGRSGAKGRAAES